MPVLIILELGDLRAKFMRMADCMNLGSIERRNG